MIFIKFHLTISRVSGETLISDFFDTIEPLDFEETSFLLNAFESKLFLNIKPNFTWIS